jgi:ABC-type glycerol-3-phosphate transport system substrate-binding protein
VPVYDYPWVVIYRKSVFASHGYAIPKTTGDLVGLATRMQAVGLVPFAFGDQDGWPAMGTFDILDMRMNGYRFHMDLMTGRAKWTDARVTAVFREWATLLPFFQAGATTRSWQEAGTALFSGRAGMYFMGTFVADEVQDPAILDDLGVFPFPVFGNQWDVENAIDAPVDALILSRAPANLAGAKALLACAGTGPAQLQYVGSSHGVLAAATDATTSGYSQLQKDSAALIASAARVAQFLDRDARPDFVGANGMQGFLRDFLTAPTQDIPTLQRRIQAFRDSLSPTWDASLTVRPSTPAGTIVRRTTVTFAASVRPLGPTPATVRFAVYQRVGLSSRLALARDVVADGAGRASLRYMFATPGSFYVRVRVMPDTTFIGTAFGPPIRYAVR